MMLVPTLQSSGIGEELRLHLQTSSWSDCPISRTKQKSQSQIATVAQAIRKAYSCDSTKRSQ